MRLLVAPLADGGADGTLSLAWLTLFQIKGCQVKVRKGRRLRCTYAHREGVTSDDEPENDTLSTLLCVTTTATTTSSPAIVPFRRKNKRAFENMEISSLPPKTPLAG